MQTCEFPSISLFFFQSEEIFYYTEAVVLFCNEKVNIFFSRLSIACMYVCGFFGVGAR